MPEGLTICFADKFLGIFASLYRSAIPLYLSAVIFIVDPQILLSNISIEKRIIYAHPTKKMAEKPGLTIVACKYRI
jgi:hypothetical protein